VACYEVHVLCYAVTTRGIRSDMSLIASDDVTCHVTTCHMTRSLNLTRTTHRQMGKGFVGA